MTQASGFNLTRAIAHAQTHHPLINLEMPNKTPSPHPHEKKNASTLTRLYTPSPCTHPLARITRGMEKKKKLIKARARPARKIPRVTVDV